MKSGLAYLAVIGSAAFTGTMICIGLAFGGWWTSLPPADFLAWFAANSGFIARTIPVVAAPAALGLFGSLWLARRNRGARLPWAVATAALIGVALVTGIYHLPTNAAFSAGAIPPDDVPAALQTWLRLHALRVAFGLLASGFSLNAATRQAAVLR